MLSTLFLAVIVAADPTEVPLWGDKIPGPVSKDAKNVPTLTFRPAPTGFGIQFRRSDRADNVLIPARVEDAVSAERRTQIGRGENALHTVEHVLAAVGALQIDDLEIVMDAPEPPVMDGSAAPFL